MKKGIKYIMSMLLLVPMAIACDTEPEAQRIQFPEKQSHIVRDSDYYARLRAYKKTDHSLAFGWFGSWTAIGSSEQTRLTSTPDSMDIISMWSQWHSLTQAQMDDKAEIQQLRGTKVVFCISAKDMPEKFKDQDADGNFIITDEAIARYAKAYAKDSLDKYSYDGIDIDFETAIDHQGPLNTTPGAFKKFCEELSQYIGPKSGTGHLLLIDGNIDQLDEGIAELCDYAVSQAYGCSSASNLTYRTANAERVGWKPEQIIFTENFESFWKTGGVNYRTPDNQEVPSLLGMAEFARDDTSAGFGSYHMEYEYGHSDMPYKFMRRAIQKANPAPRGDYSKNLLSINEAGEEVIEVITLPSGKAADITTTLSGHLSDVASADSKINIVVDNSLIKAYNDYYYTEYAEMPKGNVSISGPFHFAKGEQNTGEDVVVTITNFASIADGEYLVPLRAEFEKGSPYSSNTLKEIKYLAITKLTESITLGFTNPKRVEYGNLLMFGEVAENNISISLESMLNKPAPEEVAFNVVADKALAEAYNEAKGSDYEIIDPANVVIDGKLSYAAGDEISSAVTVSLKTPAITKDEAVIAVRLADTGTEDYLLDESAKVKYIIVSKATENLNTGDVAAIDSDKYTDTENWTFRLYPDENTSGASNAFVYGPGSAQIEGSDEALVTSTLSENIFLPESNGTFWYAMYYWYNNKGNFIVDMGDVRDVYRLRWLVYYTITDIIVNVTYSEDGETWRAITTEPFHPIQLWNSVYDITLLKSVKARYLRVYVDYQSSSSYVSMKGFEVHKAK